MTVEKIVKTVFAVSIFSWVVATLTLVVSLLVGIGLL